MKKYWIFALIAGLYSSLVPSAKAQLTVVAQGKSTYSIITPGDAPASVQSAAIEFRKVVEIATGTKLSLLKDDKPISTSYISIGATRQAKEAGISAAKIPDEGFRILTAKGNLYIVGPDTAEGKWTKNGGTSNGTANGVYTFLEDYLDVRWLMPGEIGRDVPAKSTLALKDIDRNETPMFMWRNMPHIARFTEGTHRDRIREWGSRQRLGASIQLNYNHNWTPTVPPGLFEKHPEWFAMKDGKRVRPVAGTQYKLESTNQELVHYFADKAVDGIKKFDRPNTFSLSPSDGRGWSESPESLALYDPIPPGRDHAGMGSLILKWYHDVAKIVEQKYPEGRLAGYIYSDYAFPPTKVDMKLPDNFTPMLCGIGSYGYQLYMPAKQQQWTRVAEAWTKVAPENWFYYDLPNQLWIQSQSNENLQFTGNTANVTPPAPDILNFIFRGLVKADIKGATIFSDPAWSNSALANYIIAKLLWNPQLDAHTIQSEWLQRAYGVAAGNAMSAFYQKLDGAFREYYQTTTENHKLTDGMLQNIYAAHYMELETLLLAAKKQPMSDIQQQRFALIEKNFMVLQWRLRNVNYLPANIPSAYQRNDQQIADIIEEPNADLSVFPGVIPLRSSSKNPQLSKLKIKQVKLGKTVPVSKDGFKFPNKTTYMIYAAKNGKVRITPRMVNHGSMFAAYFVMGRRQGTVASGILAANRAVEFEGKAGQDYYLYIAPRKDVGYDLLIDGAVTTKSTFDPKSGTLSLQDKNAPLYVYGEDRNVSTTSAGVIIATAPTFETLQQRYRNAQNTNLGQGWRFLPDQATGLGVYKADYDDSTWKTINTGDWWQNQGFADYHGKAWYRKTFVMPQLPAGQEAVLHFSAVDGTAVVFLNGKRLGSHRVGNDFVGWDEPFSFDVTELLQPGENTIAVQVTSKSAATASGIHGTVNLLIGTPR